VSGSDVDLELQWILCGGLGLSDGQRSFSPPRVALEVGSGAWRLHSINVLMRMIELVCAQDSRGYRPNSRMIFGEIKMRGVEEGDDVITIRKIRVEV
jgi:hypothetical protein